MSKSPGTKCRSSPRPITECDRSTPSTAITILVTNSRRLVERFFEAGAGKDALGGTAEFRFARSQMPTSRDLTVFAYLSGKFFQNLVSPQYQIEMVRRLRSAAEMDMALVAQVAARSEGVNAKSIEELIKSQYLPDGFGQRADGSRLELNDSGEFVDSLRGGRGSFLPVLDVPLTQITATELRNYQEFAAWLQSKWSQIDPVVAGIRREPSRLKEPGVEHIVMDVQLTPLAAKNYETIALALGPINKQRVAPVPGDMVSGDAILSGNLLASKGLAQPQGSYRLFGALRDAAPEGLGANAAPQNPTTTAAPADRAEAYVAASRQCAAQRRRWWPRFVAVLVFAAVLFWRLSDAGVVRLAGRRYRAPRCQRF